MPVYDSVLQYWWEPRACASRSGRSTSALAFLLARAEASRARQAQGPRHRSRQRWLGPLGAPYWLLLPRPQAVSPEPYRG